MDRSKCGPEAACCVALTFSRNPPFTQPLGRLFLPVSSTPTAKMWPFNPFRREARLLGSKNNKISKQIKPLPLLYVQRQKKNNYGKFIFIAEPLGMESARKSSLVRGLVLQMQLDSQWR